ncbi:MAG: hypothetical protein PUQ00_17885 [Nostoc sp. S13]|nr:hypothetical protein [Nostoc sp. S13]
MADGEPYTERISGAMAGLGQLCWWVYFCSVQLALFGIVHVFTKLTPINYRE